MHSFRPYGRRQGSAVTDGRDRQRGQSLVEFTILVPILLILVLAVADFARLYTTMLTVESAAREAADYGAYHWYNWDTSNSTSTVDEMTRRICVASQNLPDYQGSGSTCTNPSVDSITVTQAPYAGAKACTTEPMPPSDPPCWVHVSLTYDFHLFAPLNITLFGVTLGLPTTLTFTRDSTFVVSNFGIDN